MSGGTFNYDQMRIQNIADQLEEILKEPKLAQDYSAKTLEEFRKGLLKLRVAYVYAQRIDWLLAGDDGEDSFHTRLQEDLLKTCEDPENDKPEVNFGG